MTIRIGGGSGMGVEWVVGWEWGFGGSVQLLLRMLRHTNFVM